MTIGGLQKTTLIDFPGKVGCVVFLVGCNFSCPFCHNRDLVTLALFRKSKIKEISKAEFFSFLDKRKGILEGVCITGGEPTLNADLPEFIKKIKKLGFQIKLDTNGSNPAMLQKLLDNGDIDYVAMDIKSPFKEYSKVSGKFARSNAVTESLQLLFKAKIPFELRTTVVSTIHSASTIKQMTKDVKRVAKEMGVFTDKIVWYLQNFRPVNCLDKQLLKVEPFTEIEMGKLLEIACEDFPLSFIRD